MDWSERFNRWYDQVPDEWRFQVILWPFVIVGAINMLLTIAGRFPFGLLVVFLAIAGAAIRLPYAVRRQQAGQHGAPGVAGPMHAPWIASVNQRYEALPEHIRFWLIPAFLIVAGGLNMALTIGGGFPFGLLFLFALLFVAVVRIPWEAGWIAPSSTAAAHHAAPVPVIAPAPGAHGALTHETTPPVEHVTPHEAAPVETPLHEDAGES